jgi:Neuraminidase-like domain/Putative peptidoglycan binding domain
MNLSGRDLKIDLQGDDVALLHKELVALGLAVSADETAKTFFGKTTFEAVRRFQDTHKLPVTGVVEASTAAAINKDFDALNPPDPGGDPAEPAEEPWTVTGVVAAPARGTVPGLPVVVLDRSVQSDVTLGQGTTDSAGAYLVSYLVSEVRARGKDNPDLVAQVMSGEQVIGTSEVRYNAGPAEQLDVLLDADATGVPSEHDALTSDLGRHYAGSLADLREDDQNSDITYLARKTGWDARAVALAAQSQIYASTGAAAPAATLTDAHYYALLRAGLGQTADDLYALHPDEVAQAWTAAAKSGIVPAGLTDTQDAALQSFEQVAASHALDAVAVPGASSLRALLQRSLGDDAEKQQTFSTLLFAHRDDRAALWPAVTEALGAEASAGLQLDGQLAVLTLDNAPLIDRLHDTAGVASAADLVSKGLHEGAAWLPLLGDAIPEAIAGADLDARKQAYAEAMAAQVRLSYPSAVTAALVGAGTLPVADPHTKDEVQSFLADHAADFHIGLEPVRRYAVRTGVQLSSAATTAVQGIQRVYQLTRDDRSMGVLLAAGLDSAYKIANLGTSLFIKTYADSLGGPAVAEAVALKAIQVHTATLNVATNYLTSRAGLTLGSPASPILKPSTGVEAAAGAPPAPAAGAGAAAAPVEPIDLEELFGSMDLCGCDECRSVLSPAAYLVDLLEFIDRPPAGVHRNPIDVLLERRPDLQHLPLSCDNTNTPLPYIDVVNETLEYFVVNGLSLAGYLGHDTDERTPEADLLANPQFVDEAVYATLLGEHFPTPLPFHRPLELLRRQVSALGSSLVDVMRELRVNDDVERANPGGYGWRDISMERLGLSRQQYQLLTESAISVADLYGLPAGTTDAQAVTALSNAKSFARRVGVTYDEVVRLVSTRFVNPDAVLIPTLYEFGVTFATLSQVHAGTITDPDLAALLPAGITVQQVKDFVAANYAQAIGLVVLQQVDGSDACDFGSFRLQHSDPNAADDSLAPLDFVKLARLIRVWRLLGWTIEETDAAMTALFPSADLPAGNDAVADLHNLDLGFGVLVLRLATVQEVIRRLGLTVAKDLDSILACWGPIGTGQGSLYQRLFLSPSFLATDPDFSPDATGAVLQNAAETVGQHTDALRAAIGLTGAELAQVIASLPAADATPLTLDAVSALYRHAWLARRLKLSVAEFMALIAHSGLAPFDAPEPPAAGILALIDLLDDFKVLRLKTAQALYLAFDEDLTGTSATSTDSVAALARTLRSGFADVDAQFAVVDDPTGDIARSRMAQVYGEDAAAFFFALIGGTFSLTVPYANATETLDPAVVAASDGLLTYDDLQKTLSATCVLSAAIQAAVAAVAGVPAALVTAVNDLATLGAQQTVAFFARYPELDPLYQTFLASAGPEQQKRRAVLDAFLPDLVRRRRDQQAVLSLSGVLRVDPALTTAITSDVSVLHADADPTQPALTDLTEVGMPGLTTTLFWAPNVGGVPDSVPPPTPTLDYGPAQPLPHGPVPGAPVSGTWAGYLEAPATGEFALAIDTDAAAVTLTFGGAVLALDHAGNRWRTHDPLTLTAGTLTSVLLTAEGIAADLTLRWESAGLGWQVVPGRQLYPHTALDALAATYTRVRKVCSLATTARITPAETTHLATDLDLAVGGHAWPNALRVGDSTVAATDPVLSTVLARFATFARLKARFAPKDERLLDVLADPALAVAGGGSGFDQLTQWPPDLVDTLLGRLGAVRDDLRHLATLDRLTRAADVVTTLGTSATAALVAATNDPTAQMAADFQAAVRARYADTEWLTVIKPINDDMRGLQRDALVAYVLRRLSENPATEALDTPDKLFEYFLMDVEMEPCTLTSRIRHALSSVQLFIDRCLMNLEPEASPASIDPAEWEWMNRYRVWEAARKVFLWPENWLEPELRDDSSPFFTEVIGELLQGDVTDDRASDALAAYLTKLEEVAHLDPCGIYVDHVAAGAQDDIIHVVARTAGAHRKYFYRKQDAGVWTPWNQIKLDIEDNPVLPVVWKGRLFLFWLRLVRATPSDPASVNTSGPTGNLAGLTLSAIKTSAADGLTTAARVHIGAVLSYSEYVAGKWQPVRTSDPDRPTELGSYPAGGAGAFDRSLLQLSASHETDALTIGISGSGGSHFTLYTSHSEPVRAEDELGLSIDEVTIRKRPARRNLSAQTAQLVARYFSGGFIRENNQPLSRPIIDGPTPMKLAAPAQSYDDPWNAPFLVGDAQNAFFVTSTQSQVSVGTFNGFGSGSPGGRTVLEAPFAPIIWQEVAIFKKKPDPWKQVVTPVDAISDPANVTVAISEDAQISKAIGTLGSVSFGGREIGPGGAIAGAAQEIV